MLFIPARRLAMVSQPGGTGNARYENGPVTRSPKVSLKFRSPLAANSVTSDLAPQLISQLPCGDRRALPQHGAALTSGSSIDSSWVAVPAPSSIEYRTARGGRVVPVALSCNVSVP